MAALQAGFNVAHPYDAATITLGTQTLNVLVARTPQQWARGMVGLELDPQIDGLLFDMPAGSRLGFHMHKVHHDLVIAFYDDDGHLVDAGYLAAHDGRITPRASYRHALEIPTARTTALAALLASHRLGVR